MTEPRKPNIVHIIGFSIMLVLTRRNERMNANNLSIRRRQQVQIDESFPIMTTSPSPIAASKSEADEERNALIKPFHISSGSHYDDEKKSASILPRSFNSRRRLIVAAACALFAIVMLRFWSSGTFPDIVSMGSCHVWRQKNGCLLDSVIRSSCIPLIVRR